MGHSSFWVRCLSLSHTFASYHTPHTHTIEIRFATTYGHTWRMAVWVPCFNLLLFAGKRREKKTCDAFKGTMNFLHLSKKCRLVIRSRQCSLARLLTAPPPPVNFFHDFSDLKHSRGSHSIEKLFQVFAFVELKSKLKIEATKNLRYAQLIIGIFGLRRRQRRCHGVVVVAVSFDIYSFRLLLSMD